MANDDWVKSDDLDSLNLFWRRRNEANAAAAARELVEQAEAEGFRLPRGALQHIAHLILTKANERLEQDMACVAQRRAQERGEQQDESQLLH